MIIKLNNEAVSEIIGTILLIGIAVSFFSMISLVVLNPLIVNSEVGEFSSSIKIV